MVLLQGPKGLRFPRGTPVPLPAVLQRGYPRRPSGVLSSAHPKGLMERPSSTSQVKCALVKCSAR